MANEVGVKTCRFDVCGRCRITCCRYAKPPLTKRRQKIIKAYLKLHALPTAKIFVYAQYSFPSTDADGFCVLYDKKTGKCLVHEVKPETCRAGPVTFDVNRRTGKIEWHLKKAEICMLAEELYKNNDQFKQHFEIATAELMRLIQGLDPRALTAILKIEEPQTFKIGEIDASAEVLRKINGD